MKRCNLYFAAILLASVCLVLPLKAQSDKPFHRKTIGVGIQSAFPAFGASVMISPDQQYSIQGILGIFGDLKVYGGRFLYRFNPNQNLQPYVNGLIGAWSYPGYKVGTGWRLEKTTETVFGFGAGAGVEYFLQGLPDLGFNAEVGFGSVKFKEIDYNFSAIWFGAGIHYYF